jgi:uncharacterized protein YggT (Ycf19 family)
VGFVRLLLGLVILVLFVQAALTWIPSTPDSPLYPVQRFLARIVAPIYAPVRRLLPPIRTGSGMGIDITPMVVIVVLLVLREAL